jgi:hypothetical protein
VLFLEELKVLNPRALEAQTVPVTETGVLESF